MSLFAWLFFYTPVTGSQHSGPYCASECDGCDCAAWPQRIRVLAARPPKTENEDRDLVRSRYRGRKCSEPGASPPFRSFFGAFSVSQTGTAPDPNISDWRLPQCRRTPFCTMTVLIACKHSRHPPNNENVEFRRFLHACIWVETRISGIESSQLVLMGEPPTPTHPIYCALGSRAYSNLNLISTHMEPDICTQWPLFPPSSPFLLRTPVLQPAATHRDELSTTHHLHLSCLSSHYSLKPSLGR